MNEERIKELLKNTGREGIDDLISYMEENGFFTSPCSTRYGSYMTLKMQIRAYRMAISLIRIRSVNTPDLQTRREGRYGRTTLLNTIMVIIMLL